MKPDMRGPSDRSTAGAGAEILGLGAVALVAMGLLAFGYSTRESNTATTRGGPATLQAEQPAGRDEVAPVENPPAPTTFSTGTGDSAGEQRAAPEQ